MMLYPYNIEDKIGFDVIKKHIVKFALCPLGVERTTEMQFQDNVSNIDMQLQQIVEMQELLLSGEFPNQDFADTRNFLFRIRVENTFLDADELTVLKKSLVVIAKITDCLNHKRNIENHFIKHNEGASRRIKICNDDNNQLCLLNEEKAISVDENGFLTDKKGYIQKENEKGVSNSNSLISSKCHTIENLGSINGCIGLNAEQNADVAVEEITYLYPKLRALTSDVTVLTPVLRCISKIIDDFGNIKDSASPELSRIRKEKFLSTQRVSGLLTSVLHSVQEQGLVERSALPTLRDGRLVIPVAPAVKRKIKGIVHDESDSGRTVYVEPEEVVEANNQIRELENAERREILRLLREVTDIIRPSVPALLDCYRFLGDIDFIYAKACFANEIRAVKPTVIASEPLIDWSLAYHPLLFLAMSERNESKGIVPLDITLTSPSQRILLISGPNAGGKSVCLKTVALLQYMLQCGLLVPVAPSSRFGIFKSIFIDIGDEQSIENDLSTYSSHLLNMKAMLRHADKDSLLLIDEFGTGTEPQIGGALAQAMLDKFNNNNAFGVITTHYQNLKHFASENDGIVNAAMLYDRTQMRPLFQLRIGQPGSSFAVEIARKTGIPEDIIRQVSEIVGSDYIQSDRYLQDILRDKRYWENKRQSIHQSEKQLQASIDQYENALTELRAQKSDIISNAKDQANQLLDNANARIEQTVREIRETQAEKEHTKALRAELEQFKKDVAAIDAARMEEKVQRQMEKIKSRQQRRTDKKRGPHPTNSVTQASAPKAEPQSPTFSVGDYVSMKGQTGVGKILKISLNEALVLFGAMQMNVRKSLLTPTAPPKEEKRANTFISAQTRDSIRNTSLNFHSEIDVRGMRADEALQAVTYFIDDALVVSANRLRILHGTGNGILRTLIRQYLHTVPSVVDCRDEDVRFGGAGVTVVEL